MEYPIDGTGSINGYGWKYGVARNKEEEGRSSLHYEYCLTGFLFSWIGGVGRFLFVSEFGSSTFGFLGSPLKIFVQLGIGIIYSFPFSHNRLALFFSLFS